ncbi:two-component system, NarL family, sensor histidine kinase DegS [Pelagirhabdus alkalitolerans]|uniref:Signal transduction histidine-protein kinase/phosphatase DegS n=1 Tax=Pelagirhabdus alkalitolerans TaxID=1612202 RepID=A0A1G6L3P1_9BACI|nr:sensor histidine kinase [Pelagirhabdus alkalitolerans]SDC37919.1 two-component system, NarL family, sensor histidine kinase DegS [Pelagirhabdus alkalitolerans]
MSDNQSKNLDQIINEMVDVVEHSKDEIYEITEQSRNEYDVLSKQIEEIRVEVKQLIESGDQLAYKEKLARNRLAKVSENFSVYSEDEIRDAYEQTHAIQSDLKMTREREKSLRQRRDYIERRLKSLEQMIEKGNTLVSKVSVISNYLNDDFKNISDLIEDANQKQSFGLQIIEAQEEERRRISREIHDGPAQMLANILLRADLVDRTFRERSRKEAMEEMKSMRQMVRSSLYEVRRIIYDLRPMALDDLGLLPTIRKYLSNVEDYHKISIELSERGEFTSLQSKYEVALFRLIQESVQNAMKHAKPSLVQVKIEIKSNQVTVVICDNGIGFDLEQKKDKSFGLIGMRERVEMLDGELKIDSKLGKGTTIYIKIPLTD